MVLGGVVAMNAATSTIDMTGEYTIYNITRVCMHTHTCVNISVPTDTCMYDFTRVCMYIHTCVSIYYIHTDTCVHTITRVCMHIHKCVIITQVCILLHVYVCAIYYAHNIIHACDTCMYNTSCVCMYIQ